VSDALVIEESNVEREIWSDAVRGELSFRTILGAQATTPEFTAGVTDLAPGGWFGHHRHEPAEIYYVLEGEGALAIDGEEFAVSAGTAAYIPGNREHGIRNTGDGALRFFYVFAVPSVDQIEYRFTAEQ
jgi:quercetin dioxygenase-like cupin family protein